MTFRLGLHRCDRFMHTLMMRLNQVTAAIKLLKIDSILQLFLCVKSLLEKIQDFKLLWKQIVETNSY